MFRYIAAIVAVAIAAAPRNVAADSNPAHLRLHGISDSDFDRGVDPATLFGAAKTSSRELSGTIVWSDPEDGDCLDSAGESYPFAYIDDPTTSLPLEDFCKQWCEQVEPEKVVGFLLYSTGCFCYFDKNDLPVPFPEELAYYPEADGSNSDLDDGAGCITQTDGDGGGISRKCYRNCSYKQCNAEPSYTCPITTTTTTVANTSKSSKSSSLGPKAGKGNKPGLTGGTNFQFAGGAGSGDLLSEASAIDPVLVDDPMLLAAEGSFSMPTEFNEWGNEFNEGGDIVSMSMENEESTIGV